MNYRHGYHAGNFADVVKHLALVVILQHLKKKETGFSVVDSHAGRGVYDLTGEVAAKTGEARGGVARLMNLSGKMTPGLSAYLELVKNGGPSRYPGSPLLAAQLLRKQDRLTAIEKHPEEFAALKDALSPYANAQVEQGDGYARSVKLLPPPSRRGLVVMDPPFEATDEFESLGQAVSGAVRKFATGVFLIWYPVKSPSATDAFIGEVLAAGVQKALTVDTQISAPEGKLDRAGLLVINPPYGFDEEMFAAAQIVAAPLGADIAVKWRAGSP
jgi:23S rRNA (adenine2030-N6)-methyltransferase